jgi:hypothetical protein
MLYRAMIVVCSKIHTKSIIHWMSGRQNFELCVQLLVQSRHWFLQVKNRYNCWYTVATDPYRLRTGTTVGTQSPLILKGYEQVQLLVHSRHWALQVTNRYSCWYTVAPEPYRLRTGTAASLFPAVYFLKPQRLVKYPANLIFFMSRYMYVGRFVTVMKVTFYKS